MDIQTQRTLATLIRTHRTAALGTVREGVYVSLVVYAEAEDLSAFYLHLSGLALHTRALQADPRVGLMIAQPDTGERDPQTLARVAIQGEAVPIARPSPDFERIKTRYLSKVPDSAPNFALNDFHLYQIIPRTARYVADFGKIYNLTEADFKLAGQA